MPATHWRLRTQTLTFGKRPAVMGIINVTPDSFSDGGRFFAPERAVAQALRLVDEGADILDIGAESTRPYSAPVTAEEELRRVEPVVAAVCGAVATPVSIDTSKSVVAAAALAAGAEIINDVTALGDPEMPGLARKTGAGVCLMHMQGTPQTMQDDPRYDDLLREIADFLHARAAVALAAGIERERICLDPGVGFGKTHQHNLDLMAGCGRLHDLGFPLLVGHSRKGFIGKLLGSKEADRTFGTVGAALALAAQGVQIIRVHDVRAVREALLLFDACGGIDGAPGQIPEA